MREVQAHTRRGAVPFTPTAPGTYTQHEAASSGGPVFGRPASKSAVSGQRLRCSHAKCPCSVWSAVNEADLPSHVPNCCSHTRCACSAGQLLLVHADSLLICLGVRWFSHVSFSAVSLHAARQPCAAIIWPAVKVVSHLIL